MQNAIAAYQAAADWVGIPLEKLLRAHVRGARAAGIIEVSERTIKDLGGHEIVLRAALGAPSSGVDPLAHHRARVELGREKRGAKAALDRLHAAEQSLALALDLRGAPASVEPVKARARRGGSRRAGTPLILCSDWHVEERVEARKVAGRNEYNPEIARARIRERLAPGIVRLMTADAQVWEMRDAILWLGGDLMGGYIHPELVESNFMTPFETALWLRTELSYLIRYVLENAPDKLERLIIPCNYGNHGRSADQRKPKIVTGAENNVEWMLYHVLRQDFADDPRVEFLIADSDLLYLQVYDFVLRFTHGDATKYQGGVGGITIPINKAIAQWDTDVRADFTFMGHWHTWHPHPAGMINGSLIGWSPTSVRFKCRYELARQAYAVIDSAEGLARPSAVWVQRRADTAAHVKRAR